LSRPFLRKETDPAQTRTVMAPTEARHKVDGDQNLSADFFSKDAFTPSKTIVVAAFINDYIPAGSRCWWSAFHLMPEVSFVKVLFDVPVDVDDAAEADDVPETTVTPGIRSNFRCFSPFRTM